MSTAQPLNLPSVADYVFRHALKHPGRVALSSANTQITYGELAGKIERIAVALMKAGIGHGDRVAVLTTPRDDAYTLFLALNCIGAIWVGINPVYQLREMKHQVEDGKPVALVFIEQFQGRSYRDDAEQLQAENPSIKHLFCLDQTLDGIESVAQLTERFREVSTELLPSRQPSDVAMIIYTSGSTGKPKGAMIPNRSMVHRGLVQYQRCQVSDYPRVYCPLPLNHVGGMQLMGGATMINAGTVNFQEKFDPAEVGRIVSRYRVNFISLFPTMYQLILENPAFREEDFKSLECINFAGSSIAMELLQRMQRLGNGNISTLFGSTEACAGFLFSEPGVDPEVLAVSVGKLRPEDARVVNEEGKPCAVGEEGEIQVPGEYCMSGYFNNPEATAAAFTADGWLKMGDLATVMPNGYLKFAARTSDMYKSGGYNIYPREIEITMETHPEIAAAVVVSVPDELYTEIGYAFLLTVAGASPVADDIKQWLRDKIANYKVPKHIEFVGAFPLLPNGKLDKMTLKKIARERVSDPSSQASPV